MSAPPSQRPAQIPAAAPPDAVPQPDTANSAHAAGPDVSASSAAEAPQQTRKPTRRRGRAPAPPAAATGDDTPLTNFLHASFPPPQQAGFNPTSPARFFNRELSWLAFNGRVLDEGANPQVPLLERLRFLSISATNLDEFYTVRVAGLRALARSGDLAPAADGLTPPQQLARLNESAQHLMARQQSVWRQLRRQLEAEGIVILGSARLTVEDRAHLRRLFLEQVFPILTPLAIDPAHPFPFIPSAGFSLGLQLDSPEGARRIHALLPIPVQIARFLRLPDRGGKARFFPLEKLLMLHIESLFPGYEISGSCTFRILRDSDIEIEENAEDLVREFESALRRRRRGDVVRMKISSGAPPELQRMIMHELGVAAEDVITVSGLIGIASVRELVLPTRGDLLFPPFTPRLPERVAQHGGDLFAAIRTKDLLLHHPYESFDVVVDFLRQAAADPNVLAIKQTLYRTSHDSPVVGALCDAAETGKTVTALVELKARFDEAANIRQSRRLERAGAHVVYGFRHLKTHAKLSTVVRREGGRLLTYTHFATGNYNPVTARVYTDLSLLTCDDALGRDANKLFNYLSGYARPEQMERLAISPLTLKARLLEGIAGEVAHARAGRPGAIWAKMNALIDPGIIDALYAASRAGVQMSLVVRGICGLRPGIAGLSENIRVKSIVGRFLEHSRVICFGNGFGLPSPQAQVFISSADWMTRNMQARVETLVPIENETVKAQLLTQVMAANMVDTAQSWLLDPEGGYRRLAPASGAGFSCHRYFLQTPSLSGRGTAGDADVPELPPG